VSRHEVDRDILRFLQFEFACGLLFFKEGFEFWDRFEQAGPLLVIECDGEAAEAIDADAAFFADAKIESAASF